MKHIYRTGAIAVFLFGIISGASAQENDKGSLSASFETNTIVYTKDDKLGSLPDDHIGTNNYLKLDYTRGKFSAGVQFEAYLPALQGFPALDNADLTFRYASWTDENFSVTAGDFYDQFGNGLVFRSWEDRALGLNNSIEGARVTYNFENTFLIKGIWGRPRYLMDRENTQVRGLDGILVISNLAGLDRHYLSLEGSYVNKYEMLRGAAASNLKSPNTDSYSLRLNYDYEGLSFKGEYVEKGKDLFTNHIGTNWYGARGKAIFAELGYSGDGVGVVGSFRMLDHMLNPITRGVTSDINMINYLPSLTQQFTYLLTNLEPYATTTDGEIGGQVDFFYNFKRGTALGGKRGTKVHLNFSTFYTLNKEIQGDDTYSKKQLLTRNFSFDVEKWWNPRVKTTLLYYLQQWDHGKGYNGTGDSDIYTNHVVVADVTYKFTPKNSLRAEAQYLYSGDGEKEWVAALLEFNFAPRWSVYASDMYNYGNTERDQDGNFERIHYYNAGFSYTYSRTRVQLSYGRNRAGYLCSGGVCRLTPAYTGVQLAMSISF